MKHFDVIIIGGSYAGLSAGMALGRSLRNVLIIDGREPCNIQTPHSHNFLTRDGETPTALAEISKAQVLAYPTVQLKEDVVTQVSRSERGFEVDTHSESFTTGKLIFATGVKDIMPEIPGFAESWGVSVVHCPYCHGYEIRDTETGVLGNGDAGFEFVKFIRHWTSKITLLTNGASTLSDHQKSTLDSIGIKVVENEIRAINHVNGQMSSVAFSEDYTLNLRAIYARLPFVQKCDIPEQLGCELDEHGYLKVDDFQKTNIPGILAAGDCTNRMRSVAGAVAAGSKAGAIVNHEMINERYLV